MELAISRENTIICHGSKAKMPENHLAILVKKDLLNQRTAAYAERKCRMQMIGVYILPNGIVLQNAKKKRSGKLPGKKEPSRLVRTVVRSISSGEFIVPGNAIRNI